ncbi:Uncharacterized protein SCF082_LOCUS51281 [Durusdinium trenchii]|uniref:Uncharacterized protein n=1 Tax=Durusdinium trenchii TaxID=1381693 RepID=A0ABP0SDG7_9DINO
MPLIRRRKHWRSTTLRKILRHLSRRSSTRSTTPRGTASWGGISDPMSRTRPNTSSISTWDRWRFSSSNQAERREG